METSLLREKLIHKEIDIDESLIIPDIKTEQSSDACNGTYNTIFFKEEFNDLEDLGSENNDFEENLIILKKIGQCAVPGCSTMGGHPFPSTSYVRQKWKKFASIILILASIPHYVVFLL